MEFYKCPRCGNIITFLHKSGVMPVCCGEPMQKITENTVDAALEKHVPAVTREDNSIFVQIGSVEHPMIEAHYIEWIAIETNKGCQMKKLTAQDKPEATFLLGEGEKLEATYEYCNLHGLWKA